MIKDAWGITPSIVLVIESSFIAKHATYSPLYFNV
jgi:hypothetical protein